MLNNFRLNYKSKSSLFLQSTIYMMNQQFKVLKYDFSNIYDENGVLSTEEGFEIGPQRFISLNNGINNNYIGENGLSKYIQPIKTQSDE